MGEAEIEGGREGGRGKEREGEGKRGRGRQKVRGEGGRDTNRQT